MDENQRRFVIGATIFLLAISWLFFTNMYQPKSKAINTIKKTLKSVDEEIATARNSSQTVIEKGQNADKLIKDQLEKLIEKIPTEKEIPYLLNAFFAQIGSNQNIDYRFISPKELKSKGSYLEFPIDTSFQADYLDFNYFLKALKSLPSTIRIDMLQITKSPDPTKLRVDMSLTAFVIPDQPQKVLPKNDFGTSYVDPFELQVAEKKLTAFKTQNYVGLRLEGFWRGSETMAFINGKVVKVGESINGYRLVTIGDNSVTLTKAKRKVTIKLEGLI